MTGYRTCSVSETVVLRGLGRNYGDRVGRESIDQAIRGAQRPQNGLKRAENGPKTFQKKIIDCTPICPLLVADVGDRNAIVEKVQGNRRVKGKERIEVYKNLLRLFVKHLREY